MITQIYDPIKITEVIDSLLDDGEHLTAEEWLNDPTNIALENDRGDIALFEIGLKKIYSGHYYFKSRGRRAINAAKEFLDCIFNTCYNIEVIIGLTPITNLPARWLSRQVGFKSQGLVQGPKRYYEMFIMTKREFNNG